MSDVGLVEIWQQRFFYPLMMLNQNIHVAKLLQKDDANPYLSDISDWTSID